MELITADGSPVPMVGFGLGRVPPESTASIIRQALETGYRHFDTAQMYGNEAGLGRALRESGLPREQFFVVSKLDNCYLSDDAVAGAVDRSLSELGLDYLDLFLVHWPLSTSPHFLTRWRGLERARREGKIRHIGVSNFAPRHVQRILDACEIRPVVNQIEVHPYLTQRAAADFHARAGILTHAWSPLAKGEALTDPVVLELADRHGRRPAQVVLRWHFQSGRWVFPKSVERRRMEENLDSFGFELSARDMERIDGLDRNYRTGPEPERFDP